MVTDKKKNSIVSKISHIFDIIEGRTPKKRKSTFDDDDVYKDDDDVCMVVII